MKNTGIQWTDHTFNPWWGCQRVSPGCENCYAETFAKRVGQNIWGPTTGRRFFNEKHWAEPLKWNAAAEKEGRRRRVFCASMADVFEARQELDVERLRLWGLIESTPWLDWQLLTKRPENVRGMIPDTWKAHGWPTNVWLGTTVEDMERANERIPRLLNAGARVNFLSCEPLLDGITLRPWLRVIDWVIVGGESGPRSRRFNVAWARSIVRQCRDAQVPVFVKQLGQNVVDRNDADFTVGDEPTSWPVHIDWPMRVEDNINGYREEYQGALVRIKLPTKKGGDPSEWPRDLRVREFPMVNPLTSTTKQAK